MATANTPYIPPQKAQDGLVEYVKQIYGLLGTQYNYREKMREIDLAYIREQDLTIEHQRAVVANKYGDSNKYQNIVVPVVMPQVEAFVTYQSSVFLTGSPIFGVATTPEFVDAGMMLETIIESQQVKAGWVRELMMFFRDGGKYNFSALECNWDTWNTASLETNIQFSTTEAKPKNTVWQGNMLKRHNPYNTFFDTRVSPSQVYCEGEFAGFTEMMSRIKLKEFINKLPTKINVTKAFESGVGGNSMSGESYYIPEVNPNMLIDKDPKKATNWLSWAGIASAQTNGIQYKDSYEVTTVYCKIMPADFGLTLPDRNTPQIFKIIVVNHQVPIYVERQTNAHGFIPMLIGVPNEDGLDFQTKSLAENAIPFQSVATAMMNSVIAARRRAISDRVLYDPSRVAEHLINSPNPSAKIPVRPSAYGKPVGEAVYPFPFRDDQSGLLLQEIQTVLAMGNDANGQNKVKQGQFVKGNKTQSEFQSVMANANGRDQLTAMLYETQVFTPLKEIIKTNILQYQGADVVFSKSKNQAIKVDPAAMRKAVMEFKISDGLLPTDKLMDADSFTVALQTLGTSPQISQGYNIAPLFSYILKQRGADLTPFEKSPEQLAYEQAVQSWQQAVAVFAKQLENGTVTQEQLPPQPMPEQFGYTPGKLQGSGPVAPVTNRITNATNNITNNIANQEQ